MIHHCTFAGCPKSVEWPAVFFLPPEGWTWLEAWGPGVRDGMYCDPHAKALEALLLSGELRQAQRPPARRRAPMSRVESIGMTRSPGRPASLNEARRALVNPDLRSVVLGSRADSLNLREQVAMASDTHACLDEAAKASLAGRLFVVDHATLVDDLDSVLAGMRGRVVRTPFETTAIFTPGFEAGSCPLFIITRKTHGLISFTTAIPMRNSETFFWAAPGFAADCDGTVVQIMVALLAAIDVGHLKPIGPPR